MYFIILILSLFVHIMCPLISFFYLVPFQFSFSFIFNQSVILVVQITFYAVRVLWIFFLFLKESSGFYLLFKFSFTERNNQTTFNRNSFADHIVHFDATPNDFQLAWNFHVDSQNGTVLTFLFECQNGLVTSHWLNNSSVTWKQVLCSTLITFHWFNWHTCNRQNVLWVNRGLTFRRVIKTHFIKSHGGSD